MPPCGWCEDPSRTEAEFEAGHTLYVDHADGCDCDEPEHHCVRDAYPGSWAVCECPECQPDDADNCDCPECLPETRHALLP